MLNLVYDKWISNINLPNCITDEVEEYITSTYVPTINGVYDYIDASFKLYEVFDNKHNAWQNNIGFQKESKNVNYIKYSNTLEDFWYYPIEPWGHLMYSLNLNSKVEYANFFELIPDYIVEDVNNGKGKIIINYAHEGWINDWSLSGFYLGIKNRGIVLENVILILNDFNLETKINNFKLKYNITKFPKIINYCYYLTASAKHFFDKYSNSNLYEKNYNVKKPYRFLLLNRRLETHRIEILLETYNELKENSLISFDKSLITKEGTELLIRNNLKEKFDLLPNKSIADTDDIFGANGYAHEDYKIYTQTQISIVTETSFYDENSFISEKVWKPLYQFHPFIIAGKPHLLKYLKNIGFKTFDWLFDESYDDIEDDNQRMIKIISEIKKLNLLSNDELFEKIQSNFDVLIHNHNLINKLGYNRNVTETYITNKIKEATFTYLDIYKQINF